MKNLLQKIIAALIITSYLLPFSIAATTTDSFKVFLTVDQETPAPVGGSGGGGVTTQFPLIFNLVVTPSENGATISFNTVIPAVTFLSYGKTDALSDGSVADISLSTNHTLSLSGLTADTLYFFAIEAVSASGARAESGTKSFSTLSRVPVVNALSFTATAREKDIELKWRMPTGEENSTVRIVRSTDFYPSDITDGITLFEGVGTTIADADVTIGIRYYYTLFLKSADGKYSSGAVADARIPLPGEPVVEEEEDLFDRLAKAPYVDERIASLSLADFIFSQPDREDISTGGNQTLFIEGDKMLTVKLRYDRVPELLKTIAITLADPDDQQKKFTFLLRADEEKKFYSATVAPLGRSGEYVMTIAIVDYKNQGLKRLSGSLLAVVSRPFTDQGIFQTQRFSVNDLLVAVLAGLALVALSYVSAKRIDVGYLARLWSRYGRQRRIRI